MTANPAPARPSLRSRAVLAADGCLLTAGAFGLGTALSFAIDSLAGVGPAGSGTARGAGTVVMTFSWLIGAAGFFAVVNIGHRQGDGGEVRGEKGSVVL